MLFVAALLSVSRADSTCDDESSMLQMPDRQTNVDSGSSMGQVIDFDLLASECRCPGYFQTDCEAEAAQGCFWAASPTSNGASWCQCGDASPAPPAPPAPAPVPAPVATPAPAPTQQELTFFTGSWNGNRNNWNGEVGVDFLANQAFTITHLGRHADGGSLSASVLVTLWSTATQSALAEVQVGPESVFEGDYAFTELASPITIEAGQEYRMSQQCTSGMADSWYDASSFAATQAQTAAATFIGGVYRRGNGYPLNNDGANRRPGMINFKMLL